MHLSSVYGFVPQTVEKIFKKKHSHLKIFAFKKEKYS